MGLGKQSSDYWCGWCLLYWSSISYNGHGITVTVITFYLLSFVFFLKAPRSTGESCKILDAHADRTQHKRGCPSSLGTRHTEVLTPPRTHAHTPWRTPQHPREHCSQCEPSVELRSNAGGRRPSGQPYQRATRAFTLRKVYRVSLWGAWQSLLWPVYMALFSSKFFSRFSIASNF